MTTATMAHKKSPAKTLTATVHSKSQEYVGQGTNRHVRFEADSDCVLQFANHTFFTNTPNGKISLTHQKPKDLYISDGEQDETDYEVYIGANKLATTPTGTGAPRHDGKNLLIEINIVDNKKRVRIKSGPKIVVP